MAIYTHGHSHFSQRDEWRKVHIFKICHKNLQPVRRICGIAQWCSLHSCHSNMPHRNARVCSTSHPFWGNLKGRCWDENLATIMGKMFAMGKYSLSWPKAKGHLWINSDIPKTTHLTVSSAKLSLSEATQVHSTQEALSWEVFCWKVL